jgi:hypothetical protein
LKLEKRGNLLINISQLLTRYCFSLVNHWCFITRYFTNITVWRWWGKSRYKFNTRDISTNACHNAVAEIESLRDTVIKHILLSKKNGQLKPLKLEKRGNLLLNGVGCLAGSQSLSLSEALLWYQSWLVMG